MARHLIQNSTTGATRIVGDAGLPFFPGYAIVDTLEDGQPPSVFYGSGESDLRYVNVSEINDPESAASVALRAAFDAWLIGLPGAAEGRVLSLVGGELAWGEGGSTEVALLAANRGEIPNNTTTAATNSVRIENRKYFTLGGAPQKALRVVYCGFHVTTANVETDIGNDQTIYAALEIPGIGAVTVPFTFESGAASGTIPNGAARYVSDWIEAGAFGLAQFPAGMTFYVRDSREVAIGQKLNRNGSTANMAGESTRLSDGLSARQVNGTGDLVTPAGGQNLSRFYGPVSVEGRAAVHDIAVIGIGDSLLAGANDTNQPNGSDGSNGGGWLQRALINAGGRSVPFLQMAYFGTQAQQFVPNMTKRAEYFPFATHAIDNYGTNDKGNGGRTAAQAYADRQTIWAALRDGGIEHIAAVPILQRATSTDSWATLANQTPEPGYEAGGTFRDPLNALLDDAVTGGLVDELLDPYAPSRDAAQPHLWAVNGTANYATNDKTHLTSGMSALVADEARTAIAAWS